MKNLPALLFICAALVGCASSTPHPIVSSNVKQPPGTFIVPQSWTLAKIEGPASTENLLRSPGYNKAMDPEITVDFYGLKNAPAEEQEIASYLDGIHDVKDDLVTSKKIATVTNPWHGPIGIHRFHSDYYGDHLVSVIPTPRGYALAELWSRTTSDRIRLTPAFQQFVKGIHLQVD